ncbi:hypothetical protein BKA69DRAFT_1103047 [Paraphysoderma sedebokerense]|nr:hypothetical protein BKA69DRAFT_1103047 [Paraphysoderma sedebokerense]
MTDTEAQRLSQQAANPQPQTEQLAQLIATLSQDMARQNAEMKKQNAEMKEQMARQNADINERLQQLESLYAQLDSRISELADEPTGPTGQPKKLPLTTNNSSPSSFSSRLHVAGRASGFASSLNSRSLLETFFPSAFTGLALFFFRGSWIIPSFLEIHVVYTAANLGLTFIDSVRYIF